MPKSGLKRMPQAGTFTRSSGSRLSAASADTWGLNRGLARHVVHLDDQPPLLRPTDLVARVTPTVHTSTGKPLFFQTNSKFRNF